jgi:hypothetical protein
MYNFRCVQSCPQGYYANSTGECVVPASCNPSTFADNSTTKCVGTCPAGSFADNSSHYCIAVCPDGTYGDNLKCVSTCVTTNTIASNITQLCQGICPIILTHTMATVKLVVLASLTKMIKLISVILPALLICTQIQLPIDV